MSMDNSLSGSRSTAETAADCKPPGSALEGSEQKDAPDHAGQQKVRNPDAELHFEKKGKTLYDDGLDIEESSDLLYGAHGTSWGIKP